MRCELVLGGPGTGKTTRLLEILEEVVASGVDPARVAFVSFTRAAVGEARRRLRARFGFDASSFEYCRTLHSMAFVGCGRGAGSVMGPDQLAEFSELTGVQFRANDPWSSRVVVHGSDGDLGLGLYSVARAERLPVEEIRLRDAPHISARWLRWFVASLEQYKRERSLLDYTDMLERFVAEGQSLPVEVAIVDEAQDLSCLQWQVVRTAFADAGRLIVGMDDDQAVYRWAGASGVVDLYFDEVETLSQSHRLVPEIAAYADEAAALIRSRRSQRQIRPREGVGRVIRHRDVRTLPLEDSGTWLLLARNRRFLRRYREHLEVLGLPYFTRYGRSVLREDAQAVAAWEALRAGRELKGATVNLVLERAGVRDLHDPTAFLSWDDLDLDDVPWYDGLVALPERHRLYYQKILRRGLGLEDEPRIRVDTIHGVKGEEADQVAVMRDMDRRSWEALRGDRDDELRVWYVAATRTRSNLHVIAPRTQYYYPF